jgi:putative phosphoesterase
MKIGVISDTHGHIDNHAIDALIDTDLILHAGDIDGPEILQTLRKVGTVVPVRGNMDHGAWAHDMPREEYVDLGGILVYMIHDLSHISLDPAAADIRIVVSGHTHRPEIMKKDGVLYLNPGSASFPRGGTAASVALVDIRAGKIICRHIAV